MKPDEFEQRLSGQPLREIPCEWRAEILGAIYRAQPAHNPSRITRHWFATIFWPHPKAWAALAAIWIFIIAVNFSLRDTSPRIAEKSAPPSPEVIVELRKQQLMLAELIGPREARDADRPKFFTPRPRGDRVELVAV
ncbi:MAG TPA: hypothetical protein VIK62_06865 [Verrucomicrobiae bacterium]